MIGHMKKKILIWNLLGFQSYIGIPDREAKMTEDVQIEITPSSS